MNVTYDRTAPDRRVPIDERYTPTMAKVIVWGADREQALNRMDRALREFTVTGPGVATTIGFLRRVVN